MGKLRLRDIGNLPQITQLLSRVGQLNNLVGTKDNATEGVCQGRLQESCQCVLGDPEAERG